MIVPEKLENRARVRGAIHANFWDQSVQVRGSVYHVSPAVHYASEDITVSRCSNICWSCAAVMESAGGSWWGQQQMRALLLADAHVFNQKRLAERAHSNLPCRARAPWMG